MEEKEPYYEDECLSDLENNDSYILSKKYDKLVKKFYTNSKEIKKPVRVKSQWTIIHDSVQEHFCSHVLVNQASHLLPSNICALKQSAKQSWMLYKKRECERRKRLRQKIEKEKSLEENGCPSNILLSLVDTCEICKKMYITVNLFWGVTLCDICYFNEEVIHEVIKQKMEELRKINFLKKRASIIEEEGKEEEDIQGKYFSIDWKEVEERNRKSEGSGGGGIIKVEDIVDNSDEGDKFVIYDDNSSNPFVGEEEKDFRVISTYKSSFTEEKVKVEREFVNDNEENSKQELNEDILVTIKELQHEYVPYDFSKDVDSNSNFFY